jgi:hypothetical protein
MGMTNEAKRPTCKNKSASTEHAGPQSPEMFIVDGKRVECLNHAIVSETRGRHVEIILT